MRTSTGRERARERAAEYLLRRHRFRPAEALPWLIAIAAFFIFPDRMTFGSQVLIMVMFALSLDLILGYAGIVTLGHAAFFGVGAYTVGLAAARLQWNEPISGLFAAAIAAGIVGFITGWFLLRYRGLTLLMLTLATAIMLQETGNLRSDISGGYDGLPGLTFDPLFGKFDYDLYGHTYYLYVLAVLAVVFFFVRRIVYSPFGQALTGIRENVRRMHAIGSPVHSAAGDGLHHRGSHRRGCRRAVHADECLRHLDGVRFRQFRQGDGDADPRRHRTALRRVSRRGRLHGAGGLFLEAEPDLLAIRHRADAGAGGAVCAPRRARPVRERRTIFRRKEKVVTAALQVEGLNRAFGALPVTRDVNLTLERGARRALIGPNGAGKTTLVNLITGALKPNSGRVLLNGEDITTSSQAERARRGLARTFQINQLFRGLTVLENLCMTIGERDGNCNNLWRSAGAKRSVIDEAIDHLESLRLVDDALKLVRELPYGRQRLVEIAIALAQKPRVLLLDEPAAGVPSSESHLILDVVAALDPDIAVLIIEHDMDVVFRFAREITVLVQGAVLTHGTPDEIMNNAQVRDVYLGQEGHRGGHHG